MVGVVVIVVVDLRSSPLVVSLVVKNSSYSERSRNSELPEPDKSGA